MFYEKIFEDFPITFLHKKILPPPSPLWTNPTPEDHDLTKFDSTLSRDVLT